MRKGFTLIELLAVIVILAIIALIATPIVLSIISDSKESASLRSAEMYLDAVEYGVSNTIMNNKIISNGTHKVMSNGNICIGTYSNKVCTGDIVEVQVNGEVPSEGSTITIKAGKIMDVKLLYEDNIIIKDNDGNLVYEIRFDDICKYQNNRVAEKTAGAKYTCEVKDGTSYNFYVLTTPEKGSKTINLIMDRNIYYDGTTGSVTDATNKGVVAWQISETNADGPVTVMDYLYKATKDWTNIPNVEMNYTDEGMSYGTIITTDNITKITKTDGTVVTVLTDQEGYSDLKARLPYFSEVSAYDSTNKTNAYLYDYLKQSETIQTNTISGIYGYWTLSSYSGYSGSALRVRASGEVNGSSVADGSNYGARPVITLKM